MKLPVIVTIIAVLAVTLVLVLVYGQKSDSSTQPTNTPSMSTPTSTPTSSATPSTPADAVSAQQVLLKTSKGDIRLNLFPDDAPLAVTNFVTLGKRGYYKGVIFHRVIKGFMDQAGDPTGTGSGGESIYGSTFKTEINNHPFVKGVLGVARTMAMDTNGSQFFIMAEDTHSLDGQYTAMGEVADPASQQVVDAINAVATDGSDKPLEPVTITGFEIIQ